MPELLLATARPSASNAQRIQRRAVVADQFGLRVATLPLAALRRLSPPGCIALLDGLLRREDAIRVDAEAISELLHGLVSGCEDRPLRRGLLELRRAVFHIELERTDRLAAKVADRLPEGARIRLTEWLAAAGRQREQESAASRQYELGRVGLVRALRDLATDEQLRKGAVVSSPDLHHDLEQWLASSDTAPAPELERALVNYLARMALKTSPFSTFTVSLEGELSPDSGRSVMPALRGVRGSIEVNRGTLARLAATLADWPETWERLRIRAVPGFVSDGSSLRYISWSFSRGESVHRLEAPPALHVLVQRLKTAGEQPLTRLPGDLALWRRLADAGLVELDFGIPDQEPAWLERLLAKLDGIATSRVASIRGELAALQSALDRFSRAASIDERGSLMDAIVQTTKGLHSLGSPITDTDSRPMQNVVYENCVVAGQARLDASVWQPALDDLALTAELAALYDPHLPGRLGAAALFEWRYGSGKRAPLLDVYELFARPRNPAAVGAPVAPTAIMRTLRSHAADLDAALPELEELARLRKIPVGWIQPSGSQEVPLDPARVRELLDSCPPWLQRPTAVEAYCQAIVGHRQPELVLNALQSGDGRVLSRIRYLLAMAGMSAPESPAQPAAERDGTVIAELSGTFANNSNLRLARTHYEIAFPGCVSTRPTTARLEFDDFDVIHDPVGRLWSSRLQRLVRPIHMGMEADFLLPPLAQFLVSIFGDFAANPLTNLRILDADERRIPDQVVHRPRIRLGRVIMGRSAWIMPPTSMPLPARNEGGLKRHLVLERWRRQHGIPARCFVRSGEIPSSGAAGNEVAFAAAFRQAKARKPIFIDFTSPLFLAVFERAVRDAGRVLVIEEALPDEGQLMRWGRGAAHASEFVFTIRLGSK